MTRERFRRIRSIFEAALEHRAETRTSYVVDACAGDAVLAQEVGELLAAHGSTEAALASPLFDLPAVAQRLQVDPPLMERRQLGRYEVLRELGRGGMGIVYLARPVDAELRRLYALKVLRSDYASEDLLRRFRKERSILASLDHPNIARIYDEGRTEDGLPFYTMEFVEGLTIDRYCDDNQLAVEARLSLFQQICAAVEYAHKAGVIHRDLKPSNILVTKDGVVKLLDFGIAKLTQPDAEATVSLANDGFRPLTPEYASPEQIRNEPLTGTSDVYSLGVVLYELLTGQKPYRLKKRLYHEVFRVVCEEEPTLPSAAVHLPVDTSNPSRSTPDEISRLRQTTVSGLRSSLSGDLDSIILKALCKDPWQRYKSAGQFSADLSRHLDGEPVEARSGRLYKLARELNRRRVSVAAAVFLLLAFASGGIHVTWPALWCAGAATCVYALWYAGADREVGRRVSASPLWGMVESLVSVPLLLLIIFTDIPASLQWLSNLLLTTYFVVFSSLLVRWITRRWWAGPIILGAARDVPDLLFKALTGVWWIYDPMKEFLAALRTIGPHTGISLKLFLTSIHVCAVGSAWIFVYLIAGAWEFRKRGIITGSLSCRWQDIELHSWDMSSFEKKMKSAPSGADADFRKPLERPFSYPTPFPFAYPKVQTEPTGNELIFLKLQVHRWISFLPNTLQLSVPVKQKHDVEMALLRYLSLSPAGGPEQTQTEPTASTLRA